MLYLVTRGKFLSMFIPEMYDFPKFYSRVLCGGSFDLRQHGGNRKMVQSVNEKNVSMTDNVKIALSKQFTRMTQPLIKFNLRWYDDVLLWT